MEQRVKQTETRDIGPEYSPAKRIVGVVFAVIETILALRLFFKLFGANPDNGFIRLIYGITKYPVNIFKGIFEEISISASSNAVFEISTLITIILVALIAWLVLTLMTRSEGKRVKRTEVTEMTDQQNANDEPRNRV